MWRVGDTLYAFFILIVAVIFGGLTFRYTTGSEIIKDAAQNLRGAYHLVHTGTMGADHEETPNPKPQMRREPLPIVVIAAFLSLHPAFDKSYTIADVANGPLTRTVKGVNVFWRLLGAMFLLLLCTELFSPRPVALAAGLAALILSDIFFFSRTAYVDRLMTEIPGAAMLLAASWCAVRFVKVKSWPRALALGVALGLLALTKAAFLYIGIVFIGLLLLVDVAKRLRTRTMPTKVLAPYLVAGLALLVTVAPWIARNHIELGKAQLAERGAEVMATRVLLTEQPFLGSLYFFSPPSLREWLIGPLTGYEPEDLKPGGRLADLATTRGRRAQTFGQRMQAENFTGEHEDWFRNMVERYVSEHPLRYIASVPLFAYKGLWFMSTWGTAFNILALACFFAVFVWALFKGEETLVAAFGLGVGLFAFISVFTHVVLRYNAPIVPLVVVALVWLFAVLVRRVLTAPFAARLRQRFGFSTSEAAGLSLTVAASNSETAPRA